MLSFYLSPEFGCSKLCQILKTCELSYIHSLIYNWRFFLCSVLIPMLSSSLASISCTSPRFWAKSISSFTLYPPVSLSGKEETNCLLGLFTCKFRAEAFTWWSVCRYYKTWRQSLGEGCYSRALTFLSISYS